ncbi:hypothetical protein TRFO_07796 [Tritrichomonas foetus]|uniref:Uncharacterized protein n=1 Tax=Tritrichomonas foetus TaxID=1144522 RepID=A0A1J4JQW7_9EUKA|nr:hypothetical protein TRFO_07796 [Tritrichomonas foetus]|eukprot:OHT00808.1 hypothetical protein TRFO_07796 [Tritrichomonas foetus]
MKYAKLTCVSLEAITKAGEEIAAFAAEDENIEIHNPVVARLGSYGSKQWQRKLRNAIRDIDRVRAFVPTLSEMDDQLMKKVKQFDAIDWWEPKHDRALLYAIAEYGQLLVTTWVADSERPFREHIAPDLLEDFDKAVEIEKQKGRQCKPKDPGDLAFIFKDKLRITRALLVVRYVESHREKVKERRSNANSSCGHKLPMPLSRSLVLVSLGRFNTKDSRYPIGYIVRRMYYHATNPSKQVWYEASVNDFNKFTVKLLAEPYYGYSGSTPDAVWGCINNSIERTYEQLNNPSTIPPTLMNGSYLYGFNDMYIIDSIRKQKNTYVPVPQIMSQPQQMGYQSQSVIQQAQILQPIPSPSHPSAPVNNIPPQVLSPQPNQYQSYPPQPQQVMSKTQPYPMLQPQHMMYKSYQGSYQVAYKPVPIIGSNAYQQIPIQPSPIQMPPNAKMEMTTEPLMMPQQPMMQMPYQKQPQHLQHRPHVQIQNMHSNIPSNMSNVLSTQNIPHPQMNPIHYPQIMQHQAQKIPQKNNQKIQNYIENPNHVANNNNSNSSNHDQSLTSPVKKRIQIQPLSNASSTNDPNLESSSNLNADMEKYSTVKKNVVTSAVVKKRVVQAQNLHQTENDTKSGTSAQTNSGQMKFDMLLTSGNSVSSAKVVKTHKAAVKNHNFRNTNDH